LHIDISSEDYRNCIAPVPSEKTAELSSDEIETAWLASSKNRNCTYAYLILRTETA
jgi:hypothetical protein